MITQKDRNKVRKARHRRTRKNIYGTAQCPRMNVFRSSKHIYVQLIDDENGTTLASASTLDANIKKELEDNTKVQSAKMVGEQVAKRALDQGIKQVVFDRGGYLYTGRIAEVAAGARETGLNF